MESSSKTVGSVIVILLLFLLIIPTSLSEENNKDPWWDDDWSYRQRLILPINTSDKDTIYQPIDLFFEFENTCWAENEKKHSVRVIFQNDGRFKELESQIYNLNYEDDKHIISCGLVFLIPESANGEETYYVYYDEEETSVPEYTDRVGIKDAFFSYEPIRGIVIETWTYNIMQGDNIIYSVAKEGSFHKGSVSQQVLKMKEGAKSILPNQGDHTLSYGFLYYCKKNNEWEIYQTSEKLVKSEISIDGNLMVKVGIVSESENGLLRSTVFHKYYYSPDNDKSLYSNVKHEVVGDLPESEEIEVFFMNAVNGVLKSSIIKELDYGKMPKYLHFYSDEELIKTQEFDPYPESVWEEIIGKEEDYDFGSIPWLSIDEGKTGKAHGIIFDSTNIISSAKDERDGMQILCYQSNNPNLPGLDGRTSYIYIGRNFYEPNEPEDYSIPRNYKVEFKSLYYSTENDGYEAVEKQAELYQSLIDYQPIEEEEIEEKVEENIDYKLTVYTHINPSLFLKKIGANLLFKNSYFHVELIDDDSVVGFMPSGRLSFTEDYKIDWKNISILRNAVFNHQKPGRYIVKIFLVNPVLGDEREFIGFDVIDLKEDTEAHINCKKQGKIKLAFIDQNENKINDISTIVIKDENTIHRLECDSDGETIIGLPTGFKESYILKSFYKGFLIHEDEVALNFLNNMFPVKKTVDLEVYDFKVKIVDSSGEIPDSDTKISLNSKDMKESFIITPDRIENGFYYFDDLIPAEYKVSIEYDSMKVKENINIPQKDSLLINLHDLTIHLKDLWEFSPEINESLIYIKSLDLDNPVTIYAEKISNGEYKIPNLLSGNYSVLINYRSTILKEDINIPAADNQIELVFPVVFNVTANVFDTHGYSLENAKVVFLRENKEVSGTTSDNGSLNFEIPPGIYTIKVYYNREIISQRKVDVLNDKTMNIVTNKEPWGSYVVISIALALLIFIGIFPYKYNKKNLFLKFLSITLVITALVVPWWGISGSSTDPHLETWTNLYIHPNNMITLTTDTDVIAGNIAIMEEMFTLLVDAILYLSIVSVIFIISNILIKSFTKYKKISVLFLFLSLVLMIGSVFAFYYASSILTEATVGSLFGSGTLNVVIYGENVFEQIQCSWGLKIGFLLFLISTISLLVLFLIDIRKVLSNKKISIISRFKKGKKYK